MLSLSLKQSIHNACQTQVGEKLQSIQQRLKDIEESMGAETKSSVGDKYETGRAMLHLEKDKIMQQLATILESQKALKQLNVDKTYPTAQSGALVKTNKGIYYLGVSLGKIKLEEQIYFAISLAAPIGQLLLHKKAGEQFEFRNQKFIIQAIV